MTKSCKVWQMVTQLTTILLVGVSASLFSTHPAQASTLDVTATVSNLGQIDITLNISGNPNNVNGHYNPAFAGSIVPSFLDGTSLPFLYCVDVLHDIYIPGTYYSTSVNINGIIHNSPINNASKVTGLLDLYANSATGNTNKTCLLYTSPSPRDRQKSRMPSSA